MKPGTILIVIMAVWNGMVTAATGERVIHAEVIVDAPIEQVWKAWTTEAGVKSFFAPGCKIDTCVDGAYEIYFLPDAPAGSRGGDGNRIMVLEPPRYLAFTWNAPPHMPWARSQRTQVMIFLTSTRDSKTLVELIHGGWGRSEAWDNVYAYFDKAWKSIVLPNLQHSFRIGPIDWEHPPEKR